jgi:metal-responsive CopG/Arc/MetJ family transcriptional regulator
VGDTVKISLPEDLRRELDELASQEGVSRSDIVLRSVAKYVFLRRYEAVTAQLTAEARSKGIYTEDDVWKRLGISR